MKKLLAVSLALAALAAPALAQDDAAYSVNTIGVIKYTVPPRGQMTFVSLPLNPPPGNTTNTWGRTSIAAQLQPGSKVYFWDEGNQAWTPYTKSAAGRWNAAASNRLMTAGEGFFLQSPTTASVEYVVSYIGELNEDDSAEFTVAGGSALSARCSTMYPVTNAFGKYSVATNVTPGSKVYFWDIANQQWTPYTRSATGRWNAAASNRVVNIGTGLFIQDTGDARVFVDPSPISK